MWKIFIVLSIVTQLVLHVDLQTIYKCNFDGSLPRDNCFDPTMTAVEAVGNAVSGVPIAPLSDVTSSLKPTANGEVCELPYQVGNYTWQMYFCNKGYCPTANSLNSTCLKGQFGRIQLITSDVNSFRLKTESRLIEGLNDQCLIYYYYLSNATQNQITIIKSDVDGVNETIDTINSSPFNGWIRREASFFAAQSNYKIYFDAQKIFGSSIPTAAFDEISIQQGKCDDQPTSTFTSTEQITTESSTTTTTTTTTSAVASDSTQTTTFSTTSTTATTFTTSTTITTSIISTTTTTSASQTPTLTSATQTSTTTMAAQTSTASSVTQSSTTTSATQTSTTTSATQTSTTTSATQTPSTTSVTQSSTTILTTQTPTTTTATTPVMTTTTTVVITVETSSSTTTTISDAPQTTPSTSSTSTPTTMIPIISTTTTDRMTTLESATDAPSSSKTYIIVLATVIPLIAIAIGLGIWYKRWRVKKAAAEPVETFTAIPGRRETVLELRRMSESSF